MVRGPMIGAVTAGVAASHASATSAGRSPRSRANVFPAKSAAVRSPRPCLRAEQFVAFLCVGSGAAALVLLLQDAAEHTTVQRTPGNHAQTVGAAGGQDLQLDHAGGEAVFALLAHQPQEPAPRGRLIRLRDVPAGEIAA